MNIQKTAEKRTASPEIIRNEAIALAETEGWNKLTVRALAARIGYQPPILYQHFKSKDHLLKAIMDEGFDQLIHAMHAAALSGKNPGEALINVAIARFNFALENKTLHSLMFGSGGPCWQRETTYAGMCQAESLVSGLLKQITGRKDDCSDLVTNFVALIKGYTYFATEMPEDGACRNFFPNKTPASALSDAMKRFIYSIQITHNEQT